MADEPESPLHDDDHMVLFMTADPETWLPKIVLAIPADDEDAEQGYVSVPFDAEAGFSIGTMFIQMAQSLATMTAELEHKTVEERQEIIRLESQLLDSPYQP